MTTQGGAGRAARCRGLRGQAGVATVTPRRQHNRSPRAVRKSQPRPPARPRRPPADRVGARAVRPRLGRARLRGGGRRARTGAATRRRSAAPARCSLECEAYVGRRCGGPSRAALSAAAECCCTPSRREGWSPSAGPRRLIGVRGLSSTSLGALRKAFHPLRDKAPPCPTARDRGSLALLPACGVERAAAWAELSCPLRRGRKPAGLRLASSWEEVRRRRCGCELLCTRSPWSAHRRTTRG